MQKKSAIRNPQSATEKSATRNPQSEIKPGLTVTWHDPYAHIDLTGEVRALSATGQNALVVRTGGGTHWVAVPTLKPVL